MFFKKCKSLLMLLLLTTLICSSLQLHVSAASFVDVTVMTVPTETKKPMETTKSGGPESGELTGEDSSFI